jgi:hypothetical protein
MRRSIALGETVDPHENPRLSRSNALLGRFTAKQGVVRESDYGCTAHARDRFTPRRI